MTTHVKQDDFLAQILEAEDQAANNVKKAQSKGHSDLQAHNKKGQQAKDKKVAQARESAREAVKDAQVQARKAYEADITEGQREAKLVGKDFDTKLSKLIPQAQNFLVSDLLAA